MTDRIVYPVAVAFYTSAFLGLVTPLDGFVILVAAALVTPRLCPLYLMLAASVQDAPGLSYVWSYAGFVAIATLMVSRYMLHSMIRGGSVSAQRGLADYTLIAAVALSVVVYAFAASILHQLFGGAEQSGSRPYWMVASLMVVMILSGYVACRSVERDKIELRTIRRVASLAVVHILLIGILQIFFGQEFYRSDVNLERVIEVGQLTETSVLGFARINGPFLSPNAFGYSIFLMLLVLAATLRSPSKRFLYAFVLVGASAVLMSMSKALLVYYVFALAFVAWSKMGLVKTLVAIALAVILTTLLVPSSVIEITQLAFRYTPGDIGARAWAWLSVVENLQPVDWITGLGVAAWPEFFQHHIGIPLSDPHTYPLSIPGTFGLAGIALYLILAWVIAEHFLAAGQAPHKRMVLALILLIVFVKDLVSIPSVMGNTPFTYLLWFALGIAIAIPVERVPFPASQRAIYAR